MLCTDPGVQPPSEYYFFNPSAQAKSLFYYPLSLGDFYCDDKYQVSRERYNSVLLILVEEGACRITREGRTQVARPGDLALLDCYRPHAYRSGSGSLHMRWLHFDGAQSLEFAEAVTRNKGAVFPCPDRDLTLELFRRLTACFRDGNTLPEAEASCLLHQVLCGMIPVNPIGGAIETPDPLVSRAARFFERCFSENISVKDGARAANVSVSHLTRLFKRETGSPPYDYLLKLRINAARHLLKETDIPVWQIARQCGFGSAANFIHAFRARMGMTPGAFRSCVHSLASLRTRV